MVSVQRNSFCCKFFFPLWSNFQTGTCSLIPKSLFWGYSVYKTGNSWPCQIFLSLFFKASPGATLSYEKKDVFIPAQVDDWLCTRPRFEKEAKNTQMGHSLKKIGSINISRSAAFENTRAIY